MPGRMRANRADQILAEFAAGLSALRDRAGQPSYETLQTLTHRCSQWPQKRSTIYDKLSGKSEPTEEFTAAFVEACRLYAEERGRPLSAADTDTRSWLARCTRVRKEVAEARRVRAKVIPEPMADPAIRPIGAWKPEQLGIHPAIKVPGSAPVDNRAPRYVQRQHDLQLRYLLGQLPAEPRMIVLVGEAATGKTRTAYEAVSRWLPDRPLAVPGAPDELPGLLADGLPASPCVVWIDDAREYLRDATAVGALHKLLGQPYGEVVVIATLWPVHWNEIDFAEEKDSGESRARARRLLERAIRLPVPDSFDRVDLLHAAAEGRADPRIAAAVRDCGPGGQVTQVLAAGPALTDFYDDADAFTKAVVNAAMDARRLGYTGLVPAGFLWGAAGGYLSGEHRAGPPSDWFATAVRRCTAKAHGAVAPLTPVRTRPGLGDADGYGLADFLDQLGRERLRERPVPATTWDALADLVTERAPRTALAREAARRGLLQYAYLLAKPAVGDGRGVTAADIVAAQYRRWGDTEAAVDLWTLAAGHNDPNAMCRLAEYAEERGDQPEADGWWRMAADLGDPYATFQYSDRLYRRGESDTADSVLRRTAEAGEPYAFLELVKRWRRQERFAEVIALEETFARRGHLVPPQSMTNPYLLAGVPTRGGRPMPSEDEQTLQRAAEQGHRGAMSDLAELLNRAGRTAEADGWWARAANEGHPSAIWHLAEACLRTGDTDEAGRWLLRLTDIQDTRALWHLADLRDRAGRQGEAERFLRRAVTYGDRHALRRLTARLLRAGRENEAESLLRGSLENGHAGSLPELAGFIEDRGRSDEASQVRTYGLDPGGATAASWGPDADWS
jgi:TPR repeat protein